MELEGLHRLHFQPFWHLLRAPLLSKIPFWLSVLVLWTPSLTLTGVVFIIRLFDSNRLTFVQAVILGETGCFAGPSHNRSWFGKQSRSCQISRSCIAP